MNKNERLKVYELLETQNGREHQIIVAIEELSELIKELTKLLRSDAYGSIKKVCEEIADVKVCIEQLERFYDAEKIIDVVIDYKLKRLNMFYIKNDKNIH